MTTAALLALASLSACMTTVARDGVSPYSGEPRADVNPTYAPGRLEGVEPKIPSLEEMQEIRKVGRDPAVSSAEDRLRAPALRDAALSYGARGGLAWASQQINRELNDQAPELSRTFDFKRFLIRQPAGDVTLLPPVIVESRETYEQADAGRTLRVADHFYEILEQARFAPVAPLWHTYLIRHYTAPERPQDSLIPKNEGERDLWRSFVANGWDKGVEQAREIFRDDMRRLERDYAGMIRYSELLEKGEVSPPVDRKSVV
jgi:defect-in-organelle-trafficking protein DotC